VAKGKIHPTLSRVYSLEETGQAAYDVHRAHVTGLCFDTTGIDPFMELAEEVMTQQPYASAKRVFWIVDNGSSHRGQKAIDRLARRFPNAVMVHTPVHASWLSFIEVWFSILSRKCLRRAHFADASTATHEIEAFMLTYNTHMAHPFEWKKGVRFYKRLKDKIAARSELQLAA